MDCALLYHGAPVAQILTLSSSERQSVGFWRCKDSPPRATLRSTQGNKPALQKAAAQNLGKGMAPAARMWRLRRSCRKMTASREGRLMFTAAPAFRRASQILGVHLTL